MQFVGTTTLVSKQIPLFMFSGDVILATSGGQLTQLTLSTHEASQLGVIDREPKVLESLLSKQLALHR